MIVQTTHKEQRTMTYKELQTFLKDLKAQGLTNIKLNAKKDELQAEYDRLTATIEPETPETLTITPGSFRDIIRKPLHRPKAQGFSTVKPEKRYDQLTHDEWLNDTLAFLDDEVTCEYDYIAA